MTDTWCYKIQISRTLMCFQKESTVPVGVFVVGNIACIGSLKEEKKVQDILFVLCHYFFYRYSMPLMVIILVARVLCTRNRYRYLLPLLRNVVVTILLHIRLSGLILELKAP